MNVLSLFDGMSCGRLALDSTCIDVDTYCRSEVDRWADSWTVDVIAHILRGLTDAS